MIDLRALTFTAPMGQAIVVDHPRAKRFENRPKNLPKSMINVKTVVAVHCGLKFDNTYSGTVFDILGFADCSWNTQGGKIIGLMELSGRVFTSYPQSPWFGGPFGYEISRAEALREPILSRGMLGFWRVPPVTAELIFEQLPTWRPDAASLESR